MSPSTGQKSGIRPVVHRSRSSVSLGKRLSLMSAPSPERTQASTQPDLPVWLFCVCVLATGGCGYVLGAGYAHSSAWGEQLQTPLGRIGYRMSVKPHEPPEGFPPVKEDLTAAQQALGQAEGQMLQLLVALHSLEEQEASNLSKAAAACGTLAWPRCDEAALRRMQEELEK